MSTALQICNDALQKINITQPGAAAQGNELAGAVRALNLMIANWARDNVRIMIAASTVTWQPNTVYVHGEFVANGNDVYRCKFGGTSSPSGGPFGHGDSINDGTVVWEFYGTQGPIDPSLEQPLIALLAQRLCSSYGVPASPELQLEAKDGWASILAYYIVAPHADFDLALRQLPSQRRFSTIPNA